MPNSGTVQQPLSAINRLSYASGPVSGPVVNMTQVSKQDEFLWRISRNSRALRGGRGANGVLDPALKGRSDSLKMLLSRYGIIPIQTHAQGAATLHTWMQCFPAHRNQPTGETVSVTVDAGQIAFNEDGPAQDVTYGSSGLRGLAATSSVDPNAVGRSQVIVP